MRRTKIVCTIGPAVGSPELIERLVRNGMSVARLNLSHGDLEQHRKSIHILRDINEKLAKERSVPTCVSILLDTKGAEIRTGDVMEKIAIEPNEEVVFSSKDLPSEKRKVIHVNYEHFSKDVRDAEKILLDNGELNFELVEIRKDGSVVAKALEKGLIGSRRHVNLPGANLSIPSITEKDWEDIAFAAEEKVDFLALSFIRQGKEVKEVREFLLKKKANIALISKIETRQSVANIQSIIAESDGIMVARGDLGAEVPFEKVPVIQDEIVEACKKVGKPVIVATQMLESMIENPMPTRAEVTDIAHAGMTKSDATMLSGETAGGQFPFESLSAMDRVLRATEGHLAQLDTLENPIVETKRDARAKAAVTLAQACKAAALVVITRSGQTACDISQFRPSIPVITFTPNSAIQQRLQLSYGILPIVIPFETDPEQTVLTALDEITARKLLSKGDPIVLVSDTKTHNDTVSTVQIRNIA